MRRAVTVILCALALWSCGRESVLRRALPPGVRVDSYGQTGAEKIDVLWVVDNSKSMQSHLKNVADNVNAFFSVFVQTKVDFRIAVTTTDIFGDAGRLKGSPAVLSPGTPNLQSAFASNVQVGVKDSPFEAGLEASLMALERQATTNAPTLDALSRCRAACLPGPTKATCDDDCYRKNPVPFMRPDAFLYLIYVTDEDDQGDADIRYFWRSLETAKGIGNDTKVTTAAIVGQPSQLCGEVAAGERYLALSALTGGEVGSICDANFSRNLQKLAANAVGLRRKFALSVAPNPDTIEVSVQYPCNVDTQILEAGCASVDRAACDAKTAESAVLICTPAEGGENGWRYEPENRVLFFAGTSVPYPGAEIEIQYKEEGVE